MRGRAITANVSSFLLPVCTAFFMRKRTYSHSDFDKVKFLFIYFSGHTLVEITGVFAPTVQVALGVGLKKCLGHVQT